MRGMDLLSCENILISAVIFVPSLFLWRKLYRTYVRLKKEVEDEKLFYEKHNCIVMYSQKYIRGWPSDYVIKIDMNNLDLFIEPFLYFINTAKSSLDIAAMRFSIKQLLDAVDNAAKRGVKVRMLVNFLTVKNIITHYKKLQKSGVEFVFYIDKTEKLNNIMHSKCIIKDFDGYNGFVCMGSLNLTGMTSILNNYEDVVFSSNAVIVEAFYKFFEKSWNMVKNDNENSFNRHILVQAGILE